MTIHSTPQVLQTLARAKVLQQAGKLADAKRLYLVVLQADQTHAQANYRMGVIEQELGNPAAALGFFMAALESDPVCSDYWIRYIEILVELGQLDAAREVLALARQQGMHGEALDALRLEGLDHSLDELPSPDEPNFIVEPSSVQVTELLTLFSEKKYAEALVAAGKMTAAYPMFALGWKVCGAVLKLTGRNEEALAAMKTSVVLSPFDAQAHGNLGVALQDSGLFEDAIASFQQALQINPAYAQAYCNLGAAFKALNRSAEAEASYRNALQWAPDYAEAYSNLGIVLQESGRLSDAENCFKQALQIKPDLLEARSNLGHVFLEAGRLLDAEDCYRQVLHRSPDYAEAYSALGNVYMGLDRLNEAVASFRRAIELKPDFVVAHSNLIFALDLSGELTPAALHEERKRWNASHAVHLDNKLPHLNVPDSERRLRIGYVSADFKAHSAAYAFGNMLVNFDAEVFDVIAYSNTLVEDELSLVFQRAATGWRRIVGLSDEAVAGMIRKDNIDILVDLSGHTAGNRLLVFARKPAPIQITAWGYAAGTGLGTMDILFSDRQVIPPVEQQFYTEKIRYLPSLICSFMPFNYPAVNELPALSAGMVTFGSFNRLVKSSEQVYAVWAKILLAVPGSRMILKTHELDDAVIRARVVGHFVRAGVAAERILLQGKTSREAHLASFNQIDIALDPFPHGGGMTAIEGLMMGVPVLTLRWPTLVGRVSASIMTTLGLTDWIAQTQQEYVDMAVQKAADLQSLSALRGRLRRVFSSSIIGDQKAYVRSVEQEYRQLWREWCINQSAGK
ncbi:MAG: tetratricopeptide repeat protein [Nitrosomonadales bacterium]